MDFQKFVDNIVTMTCIISIEKKQDGGYGNIRIVTGNKAYIDSIENTQNVSSSQMLDNHFVPNSPYEKYIPKDLNFENAVYTCAVQKKPYHTYIHPERYSFWINLYMMPLISDNPDIEYCTYSMEITMDANSDKMSNISASVSQAVLKTCLKLKGGKDIKTTMAEIIDDIREICDARRCAVLLTDYKERTCSVLGHSIAPNENAVPMEEHLAKNVDNFFDIVETWQDTIAGSTCLIIRNEHEMDILEKRNPIWYYSLVNAGIESLVLFPLTYNNEILGYIWAVNFDTENADNIKEILELTTYLIASEIANHQLLEQLRIIGLVDKLTGVYNRNAMNNRVDTFAEEAKNKPKTYFSTILADLNGLKKINDTVGHSAGDQLLIDAAKILTETFGDCEIYRAGGDEFLILSFTVPEDELEMRIEKLRRYSEIPGNVSLAMGLCSDKDADDIYIAMRKADERMYIDKERYYSMFGERWRK